MLDAAGWTALGAVIGAAGTLLAIRVAHRVGWVQIAIARREHALNVTKAAPKIGTSVILEERKSSTHPVSTLVIVTSIYNEGDLAASKLKGKWNLTCSESGFNRTTSISVDHLGNTRPHKFEMQFGSVNTWLDIRAGKDIAIKVDLEFRYFGIPEEGEKTYQAAYRYDCGQQQMVKQSD